MWTLFYLLINSLTRNLKAFKKKLNKSSVTFISMLRLNLVFKFLSRDCLELIMKMESLWIAFIVCSLTWSFCGNLLDYFQNYVMQQIYEDSFEIWLNIVTNQ